MVNVSYRKKKDALWRSPPTATLWELTKYCQSSLQQRLFSLAASQLDSLRDEETSKVFRFSDFPWHF